MARDEKLPAGPYGKPRYQRGDQRRNRLPDEATDNTDAVPHRDVTSQAEKEDTEREERVRAFKSPVDIDMEKVVKLVRDKLPGEDMIKKNATICPKGVVFSWDNNPDIDSGYRYEVGYPRPESELALHLQSTEGLWHEFTYTHRKNFNWDDPKAIANLNKWRRQTINRRLNNPNNDPTRVKQAFTRWTMKEKKFVEALINGYIKINRCRPAAAGWDEIAVHMNERFEGKIAKNGARIAPYERDPGPPSTEYSNIIASSSLTKQEWAGKTLEKDLRIEARNGQQIMNHVRSWKDTKAMIQAAVEATKNNAGGGDADGEEDEEEEEDDSEICEASDDSGEDEEEELEEF